MDEILNKIDDDLDPLFKKMNISWEELEKKILNNNKINQSNNTENNDNKKETYL